MKKNTHFLRVMRRAVIDSLIAIRDTLFEREARKIPFVPKTALIVLEKSKQFKENLDSWIIFVQNISSRIRIIDPHDGTFDLDELKKQICEEFFCIDEDKLLGWPEKENIAFLLAINKSHSEEEVYDYKDFFCFCFKDYAFGLDYFEQDSVSITQKMIILFIP